MTEDITRGKWEKRWHPLKEQWIVYAAHRNNRPWSFDLHKELPATKSYDPNCYLCPSNPRVSGVKNPEYTGVYIFENDHPVVGPLAPEVNSNDNNIYKRQSAKGIAKVICYHPQHDITMRDMPSSDIASVFLAMQKETKDLSQSKDIKSVFFFENKGELVGVSNPHPHCQLYATDFIFGLVQGELQALARYKQEHHSNLFEAIINQERIDKNRIIAENEHAIAFIPFFARYAYEVMIFPKYRHATLMTMSSAEISALAAIYHEVIIRYDLNYKMVFPFVMSLLQAPMGDGYDEYHLHLLIQPPLRQPGLQKFLAGPEIGGGSFMADTIPEDKAAELRSVDISSLQHLLES